MRLTRPATSGHATSSSATTTSRGLGLGLVRMAVLPTHGARVAMCWREVALVVHAQVSPDPLRPGDEVVYLGGAGVSADVTDAGVRGDDASSLVWVEVVGWGAATGVSGHQPWCSPGACPGAAPVASWCSVAHSPSMTRADSGAPSLLTSAWMATRHLSKSLTR